ncbi:ATP-binding protein [Nonomuraea sp. NPDC046570]|uniref:sensor histidine kinase n=1 Tax=Nonomuraea sp. NPDC046570 TaxID=3155255 RepID=UPI0033DDB6CC
MRGGKGLAEALEHYLSEWTRRTGITVETWALPEGEVPARIARGVMVAFEEALLNVERHSGARTVSVAVTLGPSGLRMTVSDNGHGFSSEPEGRGIALMRARFRELGGNLSVNGVRGEGTTVTGVVPRTRGA